MNATEIKNNAISDLELLVEMAINEAEISYKYSFSEFYQSGITHTRRRKKPTEIDSKSDFISYSDNSKLDFNLKYDRFEFNFPLSQSVYLIPAFKNLHECPKKASDKTGRVPNDNSNRFQSQIAELRRIYQQGNESDVIINQHKKAGKNDLIRLCWKYITNPVQAEGINLPYSEDPKAIFTHYKEVQNLPEYIQTQYKIAI